MAFVIKQAVTEEEFKRYYHLRWKLLRAPWQQAEGSEIDDMEAQIRYMAVSEKHQRQGIGHALVKALEQHAIKSQHKNIVLNARNSAVPFYEKMGYKTVNKSYLLFNKIQHFQMLKSLLLKQTLPATVEPAMISTRKL